MSDNYDVTNDQLRSTLLKAPENRSYDDLLLIKSFLVKTEFVIKNLSGLINPKQMNDLCRQLGLEMYNENSVVFHQGEIGDKVFILLEGSVDLRVRYKLNLTQGESELREKFIKTFEERGSCFGERALQNHEPRSGTIIANTLTSLITISKDTYESILRDARMDAAKASEGLSVETLGTKEAVIRVLSKMRDKRTNQELDGVASYLHHRIPFFQKFSMPQLVELCRVAELVTSWTRSILFRQGTVGQAFYVVLSGSVEVWVANNGNNSIPHSTHQPLTMVHGRPAVVKNQDITEGLGTKVNQLITGEVFGERALENEDSTRMASIVTCDGSTDLIVISREDYHNLVYVMMHSDSLSRITLLRKTDLFRAVDVVHLKGLSKFMEPKKYQLNEPLYLSGSKAIEMIIIETGECRVETEIREGKDDDFKELFQKEIFHDISKSTTIRKLKKTNTTSTNSTMEDEENNNTSEGLGEKSSIFTNNNETNSQKFLPDIKKNDPKHISSSTNGSKLITRSSSTHNIATSITNNNSKTTKVNLGRIGPNAVLCTYITSLSLSDDVFHPESVIANSLVTAYRIGKHDYYNHLGKDTRVIIDNLIANYQKPLLGFLWQNVPKVLDEDVWKKDQTWKKFKEDLISNPKRQANIMDSYKKYAQLSLTANSGNGINTAINQRNLEIVKVREALDHNKQTIVDMSWGLQTSGGAIGKDDTTDHLNDQQQVDDDDDIEHGNNNKTMLSTNMRISKNNHNTKKKTSSPPRKTIHQNNPVVLEESNEVEHRTTAELLEVTGNVNVNPNHHIVTSAVSNMIRNRINNSSYHSKLLKKEFFPIHTQDTIAINKLEDITSSIATTGFALVQLHRESIKNNVHGGLMDGAKRLVRCYMRLCGVCEDADAAKSLADLQMENIFLTLYKSDKTKENELLLKWAPFKGFDQISLSDTDHFLIYCKSAPIMYANATPSKNIFNCLFPAMCKQANQRYACIVTNKLKTSKSSIAATTTKKDSSIPTSSNIDQYNNQEDTDTDSDISGKDLHSPSMKKKTSSNIKQKNNISQNKSNHKKIDTKNDKNLTIQSPVVQLPQIPTPTSNVNLPNEYIYEFSVLSEVLKTFSTRLACLKYAISRFGTLMNPNSNSNNNNHHQEDMITDNFETIDENLLSLQSIAYNPTTMIQSNKNNINENKIGSKKTVYLKPSSEDLRDRILVEILKGDKIICIIPLFNWILVNHETMDTLDFTNCFHEKSQELLLIQEEIEHSRLVAIANATISSSTSAIGTSGGMSNEKIDFSSGLYQAFSEVGLLKTEKIQENINHQNEHYMYEKDTAPVKINTMIASQSLKILENELNAKELARKASTTAIISNNNKTLRNNHHTNELQILNKTNSRKDLHRNSVLTTSTALSTTTATTATTDITNQSNNNHHNNHNNRKKQEVEGEILLEKRLDSLNRTASAQLKILNEHNELCDVEHKAFKQSFQQSNHYQLSNQDRNQTGKLIDDRMHIIESLQSLKFEKLTLDSVVANYNAHRHKFNLVDEIKSSNINGTQTDMIGNTTISDNEIINSPTTKILKSKSKHSSGISGNNTIGNTSTIGTAGKRLAESITLLSETLNSKQNKS